MRCLLILMVGTLIVLLVVGSFWSVSKHQPTTSSSSSPQENLSDRLGKTYPCRLDILAAYNVEDAKRLRDLIHEQDKQAITTMVLQRRVTLVKKGSLATIEDIDVWNRIEKFRVRGNPDDLWVEIIMIP
jgi:hypothetical protein